MTGRESRRHQGCELPSVQHHHKLLTLRTVYAQPGLEVWTDTIPTGWFELPDFTFLCKEVHSGSAKESQFGIVLEIF